MTKIVAVDAGHGLNTPGKRTPDGEREWTFNNRVALALIKELGKYDVKIVRLDDPTGRTDVSLSARTNKANREKADLLISIHHNANTGTWGSWGGTETYHHPDDSKGMAIAQALHPILVRTMSLRDRGIKSANFHMLRESNMPAILTEGGFMDSTTDIVRMRNNSVLDRTGRELANGIASYLNLKEVKDMPSPVHALAWKWLTDNGITNGTNPSGVMTRQQFATMLYRYHQKFGK
ncbi:hypothetical protein BTS2_0525 [Bacillus sp. TS-2]|nr:hypothetical protein BTS2_0525 [Bacillus sp. TS-2]